MGARVVGDPACDPVIAWTVFFGSSRSRYRSELGLDLATWDRGRGWALWKALITWVEHRSIDPGRAAGRCAQFTKW